MTIDDILKKNSINIEEWKYEVGAFSLSPKGLEAQAPVLSIKIDDLLETEKALKKYAKEAKKRVKDLIDMQDYFASLISLSAYRTLFPAEKEEIIKELAHGDNIANNLAWTEAMLASGIPSTLDSFSAISKFGEYYDGMFAGEEDEIEIISITENYYKKYRDEISAFIHPLKSKIIKETGRMLILDNEPDLFAYFLATRPEFKKDVIKSLNPAGIDDRISIEGLKSAYRKLVKQIAREEKEYEEDMEEDEATDPFDNFKAWLKKHPRFKEELYKKDQPTIKLAEEIGVKYDHFMNLSDYKIVQSAIDTLSKNSALKGSGAYQKALEAIRARGWKNFEDISEEQIKIYSDELAEDLLQATKVKGKSSQELKFLVDHLNSAWKASPESPVSFRYASRTVKDMDLGDLCGDCTQRGGINSDKVEGWISDSMTQFLSMFYDGKFMGRMNLVLTQDKNRKPLLLIDAIEFVPQANEQEKYSQTAKECLKQGISMVQNIAKKIGVSEIAAHRFSNSKNLDYELDKLGFKDDRYSFSLIRGQPFENITGRNNVKYMLQTKEMNSDDLKEGQIRALEVFINTEYTKYDEEREKFKKQIVEEKFYEAAKDIIEYKPIGSRRSFINRIFDEDASKVEEGLKMLYGSEKTNKRTGINLVKIL